MYEADKFASVASVFDFWRNELLELSAEQIMMQLHASMILVR